MLIILNCYIYITSEIHNVISGVVTGEGDLVAKWPHLFMVTVVYLWLNVSKYRLHLAYNNCYIPEACIY